MSDRSIIRILMLWEFIAWECSRNGMGRAWENQRNSIGIIWANTMGILSKLRRDEYCGNSI